jgi:hypothetical protein
MDMKITTKYGYNLKGAITTFWFWAPDEGGHIHLLPTKLPAPRFYPDRYWTSVVGDYISYSGGRRPHDIWVKNKTEFKTAVLAWMAYRRRWMKNEAYPV